MSSADYLSTGCPNGIEEENHGNLEPVRKLCGDLQLLRTLPLQLPERPTEEDYTAWAAWHIEEGEFDGTPLGGLNAALALNSPGHMLETKWRVAMYVDDRAGEAQCEAL